MTTVKKQKTRPFMVIMKGVMVINIVFGVVLAAFLGDTYALPALPDVIGNYAYDPLVSIDQIDFEYKWNGNPEKPVISGGSASFYGYDCLPYFDAVFTGQYRLSTLEFDLVSGIGDKAGFWINAGISDDGRITGYMVVMEKPDSQGMKLSLFYVEDMDIKAYNDSVRQIADDDAETAVDGDLLSSGCTLIDTFEQNDISFTDGLSGLHFRAEVSDTSFRIFEANGGQDETLLFENEVSSEPAQGFGLFALHGYHSCNDNICAGFNNAFIKSGSAAQTTAQVYFKLSDTEKIIAQSQKKNGFPGGQYKIIPPEIPGYRYAGASRKSLDPLEYDHDPANNITDLFYVSEAAANLQGISPASGSGFISQPPPGPDISNMFHMIDDAYVDSVYKNVAVVTPDHTNKVGEMWAKDKLDLNDPFRTEIYLYLAHQEGKTGDIADGMTFTMHNAPEGLESKGGAGEGLGVYKGRKWTGEMWGENNFVTAPDGTHLKNALIIEFDTYRNIKSSDTFMDDPPAPHCALVIPTADVIYRSDHRNTFSFSGAPQWVKFAIKWTPNATGGGTLDYSFGGVSQTYTVDSIAATFGGTSVWWGFTGSTGGLSSLQAAAITELPKPSSKKVAENSAAGKDGAEVKAGDEITYEITYVNGMGQTADLRITDTLPAGLQYVRATDEKGNELTGYTQNDRSIVWTVPGVKAGESGKVTITAAVTTDANEFVINKAVLEWSGGAPETVEAENPVTAQTNQYTVTIKYVDRDGNPLKQTLIARADYYSIYSYTIPDIGGYDFDGWAWFGNEVDIDPITSFYVTFDVDITLIYKKMAANFSFYKVNSADTDMFLSGAQFELYLWEGQGAVPGGLVPNNPAGSGWRLIGTQTSAEKTGLVSFGNLSPGTYQLVETKAPSGYQLPRGQWRFEITSGGKAKILPSVGETLPPAVKGEGTNEVPYSIGNMAQFRLPEMGGRAIWYPVIGLLLLMGGAISAAIMFLRGRYKNRLLSLESTADTGG